MKFEVGGFLRDMWEYDYKDRRVILNVKSPRLGRRRSRGFSMAGTAILNRPRIVVMGTVIIVLIFAFLREARSMFAGNLEFRIQNIEIENTRLIDKKSIMQMLDFKTENNLFGFSAKALARKIMKDPDIENVIIEKKFPDTLKVEVHERKPYIRIAAGEVEYLADYNAVVLIRQSAEKDKLPLVLGISKDEVIPGAVSSSQNLETALFILKEVRCSRLSRFIEVKEIDAGSPSKISIKTRERIKIEMKRNEIKEQLQKLLFILSENEAQGRMIKKIDLQYKDAYAE